MCVMLNDQTLVVSISISNTISLCWKHPVFYLFKFLSVLPECMSVHHVHAVPTEPEEDVRSQGTGVTVVVSHCVGAEN